METLATISPEAIVKTRIRRELTRHLMAIQPGDTLPPIRTLTDTLGVSRRKLEGVLREFHENNIIERQTRQGIFKSAKASPENLLPVIDMFMWTKKSHSGHNIEIDGQIRQGFFGDVVQSVASRLSHTNQGLRVHNFSEGYCFSENDGVVNRGSIRACLLIHQPESSEDSNHILDENGIAWVSLYPQSAREKSRYILASSDIVKEQLEHLWGLGHTKIAYFSGVSMSSISNVFLLRRESFYRLMAEKGYKVNSDWVCYADVDDKSTIAALDKIFARPPYPTALIVRDVQLAAVYHYLSGRGFAIGKDISIVGTDDLSISESLYPKATTVRNSRTQAVELALQSLNQVLRGDEPSFVYVPSRLVVRGSTAKLESN